jgi:SAM-dependent methyltransferase/aryl carrier-like protein
VELHNLYGPTEAAVDVTYWPCVPGDPRGSVPIGWPVANTRIHLLDRWLSPVPIGVAGELYIGGIQLAHGYHRRSALTAERFVPDPLAGEPGARLYRTGDLARRLPGGAAEFLGRADCQVKLRGLRIELGEIENTLRAHPDVRDAAVVVNGDDGEDRLVAYVVPEESAGGTDLSAEQVGQWEEVFGQAYEQDAGHDATFNIVSWNSSYTGEPLPDEQMREWAGRTAERILALRPRRVLELGCGTGLVLFRVAPHCAGYVGTDISATGLAHVRRHLDTAGLPPVELVRAPAHERGVVPAGSVDTVVLNSVAQYFPSIDYLAGVLEIAAEAAAPGGRVFVGDVRSLPLLAAFHGSVELSRASDDLPVPRLRRRVRQGMWQEQELTVDPAFFEALRHRIPRIGRVEIQLKRARHDNELSRFRYDVVLHLDTQTRAGPCEEIAWRVPEAGLAVVEERLRAGSRNAVLVTGVPNARLTAEAVLGAALAGRDGTGTAGMLREAARAPRDDAVDPDIWWEMGERLGVRTQVRWSAADPALCDVLFHPEDHAVSPWPAHAAPSPRHGSRPLDHQLAQRLRPALRGYLRDRLPDYMIPSLFVPLAELPLTTSGKCDRNALPEPPPAVLEAAVDAVAPRTPAERTLAALWEEVLGVEHIGVTQNYFALGGDSIRGIRIVSRASHAGLRVTPRDLFRHPTIEEMAAAADAATAGDAPGVARTMSGRDERARAALLADPAHEDAYPLSPFQEHMLRLSVRSAEPGLYLVQRVETMRGLDTRAFGLAWERLGARFPVLRTAFAWEGLDRPLQVVHRAHRPEFELRDWRSLSRRQRDVAVSTYLAGDRRRGMPPGQPGGLRLLLARVDDDTWNAVLTFSYLRVDGWSLGLFTEALLADYRRCVTGQETAVDEGPPYRTFIDWSERHAIRPGAEAFWRHALAGFSATTPVLSRGTARPAGAAGLARQHVYLPAAVTGALQAAAADLRCTPNLLVQAAWAVLLAACNNRDDVAFGIFLNGRPHAVSGIEALRGPTMNVLPLRVAGLTPERPASALLKQLEHFAAEAGEYDHTPPALVRRCAAVPGDGELFDSYLVFQNLDPESFRSTVRIPVFFSRMGHSVRVDVFPGAEIGIALTYQREELADEDVAAVLADFGAVLGAMAAAPGRPLGELLALAGAGTPAASTRPALIVEDAVRLSDAEDAARGANAGE